MNQLSLFDYGEPKVPKPKRRPATAQDPVYMKISNARGIKCEHCMALYLEMAKPPVARVAKVRRRADDVDELLCTAHMETCKATERLKAAKADRAAASRKRPKYL